MTAIPQGELLLLAFYYLLLAILGVYSLHRLHLVRLRRRLAHTVRPSEPSFDWQKVSVVVQLPVFNEPNVVARLVASAVALRHSGPLRIQILDDSTDETTAVAAVAAAEARSRGVDVEHVRRGSRDGYKAGALSRGLQLSDAEFVAVFDADFVPRPDFLERVLPHFGGADVGMVQARWSHLNRCESLLTRVQAIYLDAHFAIESAARHAAGRFFNFNGTAGVWRREAIESSGGWSADTLTEDLDLSYRAQLGGWRFVFLANVDVPSELPATLTGFHEQQYRWAKGSIQTARKLLPSILRAKLSPAAKLEAIFHLTSNSAYVLTLLLALLIVPAISTRLTLSYLWTIPLDLVPLVILCASVLLFYVEGQRVAEARRPTLLELLCVLPVGIGLAIRNTAAVIEGAVARGGEFRRTPKRGSAKNAPPERRPRLPLPEILLSIFLAGAVISFLLVREYLATPFLLLFLAGFGSCAVVGTLERFRAGRKAG